MDDLDRVYHRLVSNIRNRHSEYLTVPFTVQELYETLIPYRHHRRELGIETNQDYEVAVGRLLSGERDYLQVGQEMRDKLEAELTSPNVDTAAFREFAGSKVSLAPEALRRMGSRPASGEEGGDATQTNAPDGQARGGESPPPATPSSGAQSATAGASPSRTAGEIEAAAPAGARPGAAGSSPSSNAPGDPSSPMNMPIPEACQFCGGTLPEGRSVVYCPHCGNNLSVSRCPACGGELEKDWKYCASCGRSVG